MRDRSTIRRLWVLLGAFALAMLIAAPATAEDSPYPDPLPDFPVIDDSYSHGDLLNPVGGQTNRHVLVLYVEFEDLPFSDADVPPDSRFDHLDHMTPWAIHEQFFGGFPSVRGYYEETSDGRLMLDPVPVADGANESGVDGVVQISIDKEREDWLDSLSTPEELEFLVDEASEYVDFAQFANDDGVITELELSIVRIDTDDRDVPEGGGLERDAMSPSFETDGINFETATTASGSNHYKFVLTRTASNLMTIVHEIGHQLFDMPDSYFQEVPSRTDLGAGTRNVPYNLLFRPNAWQYMHLGWADPTVVTASGFYEVPRHPAGTSFILYDPVRGTDDYFIVENRAAIPDTYDQGVGSTGLMIWRVDESEYVLLGNTGWLKMIGGGAIDPSPNHNDPAQTVENLTWRDGTETDIAVRSIAPAGDVMRVYFDVLGPGVLPDPITHDSVGNQIAYDVTPEEANQIRVPVLNTGDEQDTFEVYFEGPAGWESEADVLTLDAGEQADAFPAVIPAPDAEVREHEISVVARSTSGNAVSETATLTVDVVLDITRINYTGLDYVPIGEPGGFEAQVVNTDDSDAPVEGVEVTFELSGAGGSLVDTATTDGNGTARANPIIDLPPGDYTVSASTDRFGKHASSFTSEDFRVPTAAERIQDLQDDVRGANLHHGIENSLLAKLHESLSQLDEDDSEGACNTLRAFTNHVNAQEGRHIPGEDADTFRSDAEAIRDQLGC